MNELRRMAFLEAMGIDSYVSRRQLPGAAPSRRLAIVRSQPRQPPIATPVTEREATAAPVARPDGFKLPRIDESPRPAASIEKPAQVQGITDQPPRFTLAAIMAGGYLWLEELGGAPLAREQVQLIQAMARALGRMESHGSKEHVAAAAADTERPDVALFEWPIHQNQQLDQGEDAARAGVAGFVGRKLEQGQCRAMVLMGQECEAWVPREQLPGAGVACIASSTRMMMEPGLKKQAWSALLALTSGE